MQYLFLQIPRAFLVSLWINFIHKLCKWQTREKQLNGKEKKKSPILLILSYIQLIDFNNCFYPFSTCFVTNIHTKRTHIFNYIHINTNTHILMHTHLIEETSSCLFLVFLIDSFFCFIFLTFFGTRNLIMVYAYLE